MKKIGVRNQTKRYNSRHCFCCKRREKICGGRYHAYAKKRILWIMYRVVYGVVPKIFLERVQADFY